MLTGNTDAIYAYANKIIVHMPVGGIPPTVVIVIGIVAPHTTEPIITTTATPVKGIKFPPRLNTATPKSMAMGI